jgi:glycosyltransferase involved in cell wall biosynthesis
MPSKKEGFGIVFLEAMAYGKPVIGGAHGGTPSVVKDGETGLLLDNADIAGIANSISQLLSTERMREQFGNAGHQRLLDEFTFEKFEHNLQEVFRLLS